MSKLTHFNDDGTPHMVDVGGKATTTRKAIAEGTITMLPDTLKMITERGHKKGDVIQIAQLAGIMASKKTSGLIPLCHPLALTHVHVDVAVTENGLRVTTECQLDGKTGVEMEALTAVSVALLTVYDMCKAVDRGMVISGIRLIHKSGGKSGRFDADQVT
ncbi:MAG: cyclic pyranopterin monophosphate synthase MoaC [Alphaproteobacteria bacterium]|nr:cyclic pyranopterin monophosphate synthase MoaC [Alphaproteobacteria bacterium]